MFSFHSVSHRDIPLYKDVSDADWHDWHWQLRHVVRDISTLEKIVPLDSAEKADLERCLQKFTMAITPYYASLMDKNDRSCPVRMQAVPSILELHDDVSDLKDPLHEDVDSPCPGLTHRYPDRVLLLVTHLCSMNCRHCTRRRLVGHQDDHLSKTQVQKAIEYIRGNNRVRDVLLSGGDPFTLSDNNLEHIISELRSIEHVEIIRIGTRMPVVLPMRITDNLVTMLKKYAPIYVNTHFNHPKEITKEAQEACARLADGGIVLGNQSVLLSGLNDCPSLMKKLMHDLLKIRVKPYYIYQCDLSMGISHFRTSISKGLEIIENLRGHTTGMAVPTFVVDAPGGGGKIPLMPNYLVTQSDKRVVLRNYEGVMTTYTIPSTINHGSQEPCEYCKDPRYKVTDGVAGLLGGERLTMQPADLQRLASRKRRHD